MSKSARRELIASQSARYQSAGRKEKGCILDELVAATGYHRCYAMTLLGRDGGTGCSSVREPKEPRHRKGTYTTATFKALDQVWALSGHLWTKRLVPFLPEFL